MKHGNVDVAGPPGRWPLWVGVGCLLLAAAPYVVQGIAAWRTDQSLRSHVEDFFHAVANGRKTAALALLSDELRSTIQSDLNSATDETWQPTEDFATQILSVRHSAQTARVHITLARNGFRLQPTVHLRCQPDNTWRITRIDGVAIDPHWKQFQERQRHEPDDRLAEELAEKLTGSALE